RLPDRAGLLGERPGHSARDEVPAPDPVQPLDELRETPLRMLECELGAVHAPTVGQTLGPQHVGEHAALEYMNPIAPELRAPDFVLSPVGEGGAPVGDRIERLARVPDPVSVAILLPRIVDEGTVVIEPVLPGDRIEDGRLLLEGAIPVEVA